MLTYLITALFAINTRKFTVLLCAVLILQACAIAFSTMPRVHFEGIVISFAIKLVLGCALFFYFNRKSAQADITALNKKRRRYNVIIGSLVALIIAVNIFAIYHLEKEGAAKRQKSQQSGMTETPTFSDPLIQEVWERNQRIRAGTFNVLGTDATFSAEQERQLEIDKEDAFTFDRVFNDNIARAGYNTLERSLKYKDDPDFNPVDHLEEIQSRVPREYLGGALRTSSRAELDAFIDDINRRLGTKNVPAKKDCKKC